MVLNNNSVRISLNVIILGIVGLIGFIWLLPQFFPYQGVNLSLNKKVAIDTARQFLENQGYSLKDYQVRAIVESDPNAFSYLQQKLGWHKAQQIFRQNPDKGLGFHWRVIWYKNLPANAPYMQFSVWVASGGQVVSFYHEYPENMPWPSERQPHISQEEALEQVLASLKPMNFSLEGFKKESFTTEKSDKRTDHTFSWQKTLPQGIGQVKLSALVQGDALVVVDARFAIPAKNLAALSQTQDNTTMFTFISYIFAFLFCLGLQVLFLKKYHEGEVSVRTGTIVFFACWLGMVADSLLKFLVNGATVSIAMMPYNRVSLVMFLLFSLILWPFFSIMGFSAWSIGESLGRERFTKKLAAIDSLFNKKWATLHTAVSTLHGYFFGFMGLGILALLYSLSINRLHAFVSFVDYQYIASYFPFLIPFLTALTSALLSELSFRLFANLYLYRYLKSRWSSLLVSALLWTIYAVGFWNRTLLLSPMRINWLACMLIGLLLGFVFWKFDLLTSMVANFTIIGVIKALPLLTATNPKLVFQGQVAVGLLLLPVFWIVFGFIKREGFAYEGELLPEHIRRITERARMAKELEIARQVQMQLLPGCPPRFQGFDIKGICMPANEVGGDYYDFIHIDESHLGIVIGDVSGKGVPAAIYMTLTKGILQSQVENHNSPQQILTRVNRSLYAMMDHKHFVTLFFAVVDRDSRTLTFSRAGHNPLLFFRNRDNQVITLKPSGIALGIDRGAMFEMTIKTGSITLEKDDLVVFYTDGFTEATDKLLEEYGEKRMIEVIQANKYRNVQDIMACIIADVQAFVKGYPQHDDMTLILVKCL